MASSTEVNFTLLASEWGLKRGGLGTFNRVLAVELAKHSKVHVSVLVPRFDLEEMNDARNKNVTLAQAKRRPGLDEKSWLCFPPDDLQIDVVIGHGAVLGSQAQIIQESRRCKWIQFVHTDPEELGMFKDYSDRIEKGEQKHQTEVELCAMADVVVAVGPKLAEAYRQYLKSHDKDQSVFELTPGIFDEFSGVKQATQDGDSCRVLAFGRGDAEGSPAACQSKNRRVVNFIMSYPLMALNSTRLGTQNANTSCFIATHCSKFLQLVMPTDRKPCS